EKIGNLKTEAHSQVKSTKHFPIYMIDGKKMIFKPLSKTKPLTTPFFAYSEVYWSYIITNYFDSRTPRYYLAVSKKIEKEQPKYFEQGVLVESITPNDEKLINLYDYFNENPEPSVDIKNYINYCMTSYDYTKILLSNFITQNNQLGEELAYQILLSMLRQDQNFHYENINFFEGKDLSIAPPIDFEFSTPFLYPDKLDRCRHEEMKYIDSFNIDYEEDETSKSFKQLCLEVNFPFHSTLKSNLCLIVRLYPNIVLKFIKNLDRLIDDLPYIIINDPDNYIGPLNSDYWKVGHAYYKDNDLEKYTDLKQKIKLDYIDKEATFHRISSDILNFSNWLNLILKIYLISYYEEIEDLENLTINKLLTKLNIIENVTIADVNIDKKELKLRKGNKSIMPNLDN
ncbi:MAG: hypothetical protein IJ509_00765, partial [Bacilli bacterium]|nr:hypothetical protein [Bacilli bacterium]